MFVELSFAAGTTVLLDSSMFLCCDAWNRFEIFLWNPWESLDDLRFLSGLSGTLGDGSVFRAQRQSVLLSCHGCSHWDVASWGDELMSKGSETQTDSHRGLCGLCSPSPNLIEISEAWIDLQWLVFSFLDTWNFYCSFGLLHFAAFK